MRLRTNAARPRKATSMIEGAFALPVFLLVLLGTIVGGVAVFRHQQLSALSRAGARWASCHGATYQQDYGAPTGDVHGFIRSKLVGIDPATVTIRVMHLSFGDTVPTGSLINNWGSSSRRVYSDRGDGTQERCRVAVEIVFPWTPEVPLLGIPPINLSARSVMQMEY
jgi:Flp pilus assembly protein TadG